MALKETGDPDLFEAHHLTLVADTDTVVLLTRQARVVRVVNWDITNRVLAKMGAITSSTDSSATRVGISPAADIGNSRTFPWATDRLNLRSAGASEVTVEAYG